MKMADVYGWVQAGLPGLLAIGGVTFWAGGDHKAIADQQTKTAAIATQQSVDHDKVIALGEKVKDIKDDVSEIKGDVKTLLSRH